MKQSVSLWCVGYRLHPGAGRHRESVLIDVLDQLAGLRPSELDDLASVLEKPGLTNDIGFHCAGIAIPKPLLARWRRENPVLDRVFREDWDIETTTVSDGELASFIVAFNRLDDVPDHRDQALKRADQDLVDHIRTRRDKTVMLAQEPELVADVEGSPSP